MYAARVLHSHLQMLLWQIHCGVDHIWETGTALLLPLSYSSELGVLLESPEIITGLPAVYGALISSRCGGGVAPGLLP